MQQLLMRRFAAPAQPIKLAEGYTMRRYSTDADAQAWIDIAATGKLLPEGAAADWFFENMVTYRDLAVENVFFICHEGKPIATITAVKHREGYADIGYVHMVACLPEYRGKGLGTQLNNIVCEQFEKWCCVSSYLTTDDFRLPAIRSYISAGFLPDMAGEDMDARWRELAKLMGVGELKVVRDGVVGRLLL